MFDGKKICDQPVDNSIKQYDEVDLSKQKALDPDPRAIQQIVFQGVVGGADKKNKTVYYSWKIKRNSLRVLQRNTKSSVNSVNGWIQ